MKDPAVRSVSLAARGLWIDMLCLMHENVRRGYLQHAPGKPVSAVQLARMTGCDTDEVSRLLQELDDSGVYSRTEHRVIFSRRMVRDESLRKQAIMNGRKGGNPLLKGVNPPLNDKDKPKPEDEDEDIPRGKRGAGGRGPPPPPPPIRGSRSQQAYVAEITAARRSNGSK